MKHANAHSHWFHRSAAILGVVGVVVLAIGADVAMPYHAHIPIALAVLAVAAYLALHDRIHSVWLTHRRTTTAIPARISTAQDARFRVSRPSLTRASRPGWR